MFPPKKRNFRFRRCSAVFLSSQFSSLSLSLSHFSSCRSTFPIMKHALKTFYLGDCRPFAILSLGFIRIVNVSFMTGFSATAATIPTLAHRPPHLLLYSFSFWLVLPTTLLPFYFLLLCSFPSLPVPFLSLQSLPPLVHVALDWCLIIVAVLIEISQKLKFSTLKGEKFSIFMEITSFYIYIYKICELSFIACLQPSIHLSFLFFPIV